MPEFKVHSEFEMTGDQPQAVEKIAKSIESGNRFQTLLGVTGSGKTYTMAKIIEKVQKPTLIISHNKTLAAQLHGEMKEFFPDNAVEYFVSYYDFYQPEAYVASTDTYIEKDADINDEIDKLRHSATAAVLERKDVIIVASVSCIYGLGSPNSYRNQLLSLRYSPSCKPTTIGTPRPKYSPLPASLPASGTPPLPPWWIPVKWNDKAKSAGHVIAS